MAAYSKFHIFHDLFLSSYFDGYGRYNPRFGHFYNNMIIKG